MYKLLLTASHYQSQYAEENSLKFKVQLKPGLGPTNKNTFGSSNQNTLNSCQIFKLLTNISD
jgi:hypothetical protein